MKPRRGRCKKLECNGLVLPCGMTFRQRIGSYALVAFLMSLLVACTPARSATTDPTREIARAAILTTAEAVRLADVECARIVRETRDVALGEKCVAIYGKARTSLVAAAIAVDTWEKAEAKENVTCAVLDATAQLTELARETTAKGGQPLTIAEDAARLAKLLGSCATSKKGSAS